MMIRNKLVIGLCRRDDGHSLCFFHSIRFMLGLGLSGAHFLSPFYDTLKPYSPTLSQILYPVATTSTRIKQISWNQPKISVPLHRQSEQTASERQVKK